MLNISRRTLLLSVPGLLIPPPSRLYLTFEVYASFYANELIRCVNLNSFRGYAPGSMFILEVWNRRVLTKNNRLKYRTTAELVPFRGQENRGQVRILEQYLVRVSTRLEE